MTSCYHEVDHEPQEDDAWLHSDGVSSISDQIFEPVPLTHRISSIPRKPVAEARVQPMQKSISFSDPNPRNSGEKQLLRPKPLRRNDMDRVFSILFLIPAVLLYAFAIYVGRRNTKTVNNHEWVILQRMMKAVCPRLPLIVLAELTN
jgi:hypothetical protein